jgi:uncharacterized repeat protein (TIGR01451 family)
MNVQFRHRLEAIQVGTTLLVAVLLAGSIMAALLPQTVQAQEERRALSLRLVSRSNYAEITAGETKVLLLEVTNTGNTTIEDIELSALLPEGWKADLEPARIVSLDPANSQVVQVTLETPSESAKERHEIILRADSATVHRAISVWMELETPPGRWRWVAGILAAVVIAGFAILFWRFGRE